MAYTKFLTEPHRAKADYLVSGDKDLLEIGSFEGIKISPLESLRLFLRID